MGNALRNLLVFPGCGKLWHSLIPWVAVLGLVGCGAREVKWSMQKVGPQQSIVGESAEYTITLNNVGEGRATDVVVRDSVPSGLRYLTSSPVGHYDPKERVVAWRLGTLEAGAGTTLGVTFRGEAQGQQCNRVEVEAARGPRGTARSCTMLAGLPDLKVGIRASPDPLEAGFTTTFTIEIRNLGSATATNIRVNASLSPGLSYVSSSGPTASTVAANVVRFAPLPTLPPGASTPYKVLARAQTSGVARLSARVEADHLSHAMTAERDTRVSGRPVSSPDGGTTPKAPAQDLIHLGSRAQIGGLVSVKNISVRGPAVTGRIVNRSSRTLHNVYLIIRSVWLWDDERNPGEGDPSTSVRYQVPGKVPAKGFLPFFYRPLPDPGQPGGHYEIRVSITEFSEVP